MGSNRLPWRAPAVLSAALSPARSAVAAAVAVLLAGAAYGADDTPPPLPAATPPAAKPAPPAPGSPAAEPAEAAEQSSEAPTGAKEGEKPKPYAQIEQKHVGRRVSEVIVTPAGFTYHYTMIHLDDQDPGTTPLHPHPELSVPRLLRFDF